MKISFRKETAVSHPALLFCWQMQLEGEGETAVSTRTTSSSRSESTVSDRFIPDLYLDFFFIQTGTITLQSSANRLPRQCLKTLQKRPLTLNLNLNLTLFGARFRFTLADYLTQPLLPPDSFLPRSWIEKEVTNLANFSAQLEQSLVATCLPKPQPALLAERLAESKNLSTYSARHKRRLIKARYGLSHKEMLTIDQVHRFLRQGCDFAERTPRIIDYVHNDFYDQPHLNNAFKKVTGLSPLDYFEAPSLIQDNLMAVSYNETAVF